ncbi:MAG: hypothetical protein AAF217_00875 [Pseudomonadota bacterium]
MFDQIEVYNGGVISGVDAGGLVDDVRESGNINIPQTADKIIAQAHSQAELILQAARDEAEQYLQQKREEAFIEKQKAIAESVNQTAVELGMDLWSAKNALATIVQQALENMIGEAGHSEACLKAVETAARKFCKGKSVRVFASATNANRMQLIALSKRDQTIAPLLEFHDDPALQDDRCILDVDGKQVEVSIDAQLAAIKKACGDAVASTSRIKNQAAST